MAGPGGVDDGFAASSGIYEPFPSFLEWLSDPFDASVVDEYAARLEAVKTASKPGDWAAAVEVATRYAAVDTGAIEGLYSVDRGFTRTIATQAAAWEAVLDSRGSAVRDAIRDALEAYEYVLDAATQRVDITERWIRELHELACRSQATYRVYTANGPEDRPLPKGTYKAMPNSPTNAATGRIHAYAAVLDTAPEMHRLVQELKSDAFGAAHPVVQAAYAHYAYVCIHPFPDGNGRVARALASVYLYRSPGVPLVVFADQRLAYLDALEAADAGDAHSFVTFLADRTVDAIGLVTSTVGRADPESAAAQLHQLFVADDQTDSFATTFSLLIKEALLQKVRELDLPPSLVIDIGPVAALTTPVVPPGWRPAGSEPRLSMWARSTPPWSVSQHRLFAVVANASTSPQPLICLSSDGSGRETGVAVLEAWPREIVPSVSDSLRVRLDAWADRQVAGLLGQVRAAISGS